MGEFALQWYHVSRFLAKIQIWTLKKQITPALARKGLKQEKGLINSCPFALFLRWFKVVTIICWVSCSHFAQISTGLENIIRKQCGQTTLEVVKVHPGQNCIVYLRDTKSMFYRNVLLFSLNVPPHDTTEHIFPMIHVHEHCELCWGDWEWHEALLIFIKCNYYLPSASQQPYCHLSNVLILWFVSCSNTRWSGWSPLLTEPGIW